MNVSYLLEVVSGKRKGFLAGVVRTALWCMTPLYRIAINRRNRHFDSKKRSVYRVDVPVISIGNITTGGTGKTPMVVWVCQLLQRHGGSPGIVSRGYGSPNQENSKNDEALELENRLPGVPHEQNPDRFAAAKKIVEEHSVSSIVLDDGFQHRSLARDLNVVLIDASNPFGHGYLLPRGLLREPLAALSRADAVVITRAQSVSETRLVEIRKQIGISTSAPIAVSHTRLNSLLQFSGKELPLEHGTSKRWFAFSGIGNPTAFESSIQSVGLKLHGTMQFRDHHWYDPLDLKQIVERARKYNADHLICTHKDLVKIETNEIDGLPLFALVINVEITEGCDQLKELILNAVQ